MLTQVCHLFHLAASRSVSALLTFPPRHGHFMLLQAHGCRGSVSVACLSVRSMKALTAQQQALCQSTEELTRCSQIEEMCFCSLKHHLCFRGTGWWGGKGASYFVDSDCTDLS